MLVRKKLITVLLLFFAVGYLSTVEQVRIAEADWSSSSDKKVGEASAAIENGDYVLAHELLKEITGSFYLGDKENSEGQFLKGRLFEFGHGVPQNYSRAIALYGWAAKNGHGKAQYRLGELYASGRGVMRNFSEAENWYTRAAASGDPAVQYDVAEKFWTGRGVQYDYMQAMMWFRKAAEQGHGESNLALAEMYHYGDSAVGIWSDNVMAYAFANIAAGLGVDAAHGKRDRYSKNLLSAEVAESQSIAIAQWELMDEFVNRERNKKLRSRELWGFTGHGCQYPTDVDFDRGHQGLQEIMEGQFPTIDDAAEVVGRFKLDPQTLKTIPDPDSMNQCYKNGGELIHYASPSFIVNYRDMSGQNEKTNLEYNGAITVFKPSRRIVPLIIEAKPNSNFLLKIAYPDDRDPIMTVFLRGGSSFNVKVPSGTYRISYAFGDSWHGYGGLFGEGTQYRQFDDLPTFKKEHNTHFFASLTNSDDDLTTEIDSAEW